LLDLRRPDTTRILQMSSMTRLNRSKLPPDPPWGREGDRIRLRWQLPARAGRQRGRCSPRRAGLL